MLDLAFLTVGAQAEAQASNFNEVWKVGLGGIAALAGVAALAFFGHRTFKSQAPKVQKVGQTHPQDSIPGVGRSLEKE